MLSSLVKFFEIPADFTFWQLVNSQFLATVVGAIVAILVGKTATAVTDAAVAQEASNANQKAQQLETQDVSKVEDGSVTNLEEDYREEAKSLVVRAKGFIDNVVSGDLDGRHQRTYTAIGKTDYTARAVALNERGRLSEPQLQGAATFFAEWKPFERGRAALKPVPKTTYANMNSAYVALTQMSGSARGAGDR